MKTALSWLVLISLLMNPGIAFSIDIAIKGPYRAKTRVRIGALEGVIVSTKGDGMYVKVAKEDVKSAEVQEFVFRYRDKEWDRAHLLLYIPRDVWEGQEKPDGDSREPEKEPTTMDCYIQGRRQGESLSTTGSTLGGFAGGLFLGVLGTVIAVVAQESPSMPLHLLPEEEDCKLPFVQGYQERGKAKKKSAALGGGLLGTLTLIIVVVAATSGD